MEISTYLYTYMLCGEIILVFFALLVIYFLFLCYRASKRQQLPVEEETEQPWTPAVTGLDESQIQRIPMYFFKEGDSAMESRDCVVCLAGFEENEKLRMLPNCNHIFHAHCVDEWLEIHATCPLCRTQMMGRAFSFVLDMDRIEAEPQLSLNSSPSSTQDHRVLLKHYSMPSPISSSSATV